MILTDFLATIGGIVASAGVLALLWVGIKSKLPQETIKVQNDAIRALEVRNDQLEQELERGRKEREEQLSRLEGIIHKLEARVELLETLPLSRIDENLARLADTIIQLNDLGHTNQALIKQFTALMAGGNTTTTTNNYK